MTAGQDPAESLGLSRTQARILSAFAELVEELGSDDVSFRLVARRAGMGERTVFRHYGTRGELQLAAASWLEHAVFTRRSAESIFDLPLIVRESMEAYARRPELAHLAAEAATRGDAGLGTAPDAARLDELIRQETPWVGAQERAGLVAALCHLDSASSWVALDRQVGPEVRDVADAAGWAAEALLDALRAPAGDR
ncbi:TetR/AcrR family transcriptional regulator [Nesterenkonia sp. CL21]|uniref:TetR/AcrR family transcriptional regulator n=1 Tax=Nesterenkonia sp. CL21 TaxID=3064894 RepID=UPI00287AC2C0|nr:TetR/AcrR family transcriptional regulator [Nesterenkonia sp. CL21]MDS2173728.1 TetR/AcrR family transcriptional regulator [Nesterenkonia sp. CL21]